MVAPNKKIKFARSAGWDAVISNSVFIQFAIMFIGLIKVWGDSGLGNITMGNFLYAMAITIPLSLITGLLIVMYESRKGKNDV
ncbi:hypothetical protein CWB63_13125 [Pseudoalteromonas sp. S409]|nr:hypothetical protein CWB64_08165 [Pseudoalteromonas sp. S410]TMN92760.1 hypothetical protein CWB62_03355 [Pseudoalteromonas sp. S408]TMN97448.1 hypothetical protein CWB63_13125 [Pseudoalteromonas sp. S409]TMO01084.1 hypothetical protein CWB61_02000 [Pseudoalteromonas sp. S407]TMO11282.1 hypothetical protein CWB57_08310 [Pseudoalteromonas sp. S186]TMO17246.1 hypothetical protein CWB56_05060 [Pseudoalteromonas sp. S185]